MFNKMTDAIRIISLLKNDPLVPPNAISVDALKQKFDDGANAVRIFVNSLIDALDAGTAASNIGAKYTEDGQEKNVTVQYAINALAAKGSGDTEDVSALYTGTLTAAGWSGSTAPYTQTVTINGVLSTDKPIIDLVASNTYSQAAQEDEAWTQIYKADTVTNGITFYAEEKPTVALNFQARCIRK